MLDIRLNSKRLDTRFHTNGIEKVLPEFFATDYPNLAKFLHGYYEHSGEENVDSFDHQIKNIFNIRDITSTTIEAIDLILGEVGDGLEHTSFAQNPRLMVKLISDFYRAKGTQISVEQFFKSFFAEDVEISYPKNNVFILNDSKIGSESLKYITDNRRYQIFSINIKTGLSFSDYEALYRKFVHPAGFYLSADVVTQSEAFIRVSSGDTIDPLETPNYPLLMGASVSTGTTFNPALTTLIETDSADVGIILNSNILMSNYENESFQSLLDDGHQTIGDLASIQNPETLSTSISLGNDTQTINVDDHK